MGHLACITETKNVSKILIGEPEDKRQSGRPRLRWEDSIKLDLKIIGWEGEDWIHVVQDRGWW
jgi:hypothetical protein